MTTEYKKYFNELCQELHPDFDNPSALLLAVINKHFCKYRDTFYWEDIEQIGSIALWRSLSSIPKNDDITKRGDYLKISIIHAIQEELGKLTSMIHINRKTKVTKIRYMNNHGFSDAQIANAIGRTPEYVRNLILLDTVMSTESAVHGNEEDDELINFLPNHDETMDEYIVIDAIKNCCSDDTDYNIIKLRYTEKSIAETAELLCLSREEVYNRLFDVFYKYLKQNTAKKSMPKYCEDELERVIFRLETQKMTAKQICNELYIPISELKKNLTRLLYGKIGENRLIDNPQKTILLLINACHDEKDRLIIKLGILGMSNNKMKDIVGLSRQIIDRRLRCIRDRINDTVQSSEFKDTIMLQDIWKFCKTEKDMEALNLYRQGITLSEIGKIFGCSRASIAYRFKTIANRYRQKTGMQKAPTSVAK